MIKKFITSLILGIVFLSLPAQVMAGLTFSGNSTSLTPEQHLEVNINLSLQGQGNKTYYLEGAFKKEGGSNYFGLTETPSGWVSYTSSNFTTLKSITTDSSGNFQGILKAKLDLASSYFSGNGNYTFQIKRFTSAGSASWSDTDPINIGVTGFAAVNSSPSPSPTSSSTTIAPPETKSVFLISGGETRVNSSSQTSLNIQIVGWEANKKHFLKGAFFKSGSTNYFGKTLVGGSFVKNSQSSTSQYPLTTDGNGSWTGNLTIMPDPDDSGYTGSGDYLLKVGRYDSAGSNLLWSNQVAVYINNVAPAISSTISPKSSTSIKASTTSSPNVQTSILSLSSPTASSSIEYQLPDLSRVAGISSQAGEQKQFLIESQKQINYWYIAASLMVFLAGCSILVYAYKSR